MLNADFNLHRLLLYVPNFFKMNEILACLSYFIERVFNYLYALLFDIRLDW